MNFLHIVRSLEARLMCHCASKHCLLITFLPFTLNRALHLAVINSQQEVIHCLIEVMAGLPESYVNEFNFLRQVSHDYSYLIFKMPFTHAR